jgi:hypothetical protein
MKEQIEIDLDLLTKAEKRVWIKPTSKRKGHYRKIKGAKGEVGISEQIDKALSVEDQEKRFWTLNSISQKGHVLEVANKIVNNENLCVSARSDYTSHIIASDTGENRDKALLVMYKDKSNSIRYDVALEISERYLPGLFDDSDFGLVKLAKKRHDEWLSESRFMRSSAAKECSIIADEFIETGKFNPGKETEKVIRSFDGVDRSTTRTLLASVDILYRDTVYESFHGKSRDEWIKTSNHEYSGVLKNAISKLYGGEIQHHDLIDLQEFDVYINDSSLDIEKNDGITKEGIEKYVDLQHKLTIQMLEIKYPGQDEFVVYRGTTLNEVNIIGGDKEVNIKQNPISSWSLKENVAKKFAEQEGGVVIKTTVKKEDIWSCFLTHNFGIGCEYEMIVIGNKERIGEII